MRLHTAAFGHLVIAVDDKMRFAALGLYIPNDHGQGAEILIRAGQTIDRKFRTVNERRRHA